MSFVILPKKDPKKLQNSWAPSLTTVHISLVGWDQGALWEFRLPVKALALSAHRPFGPARFARGLDK